MRRAGLRAAPSTSTVQDIKLIIALYLSKMTGAAFRNGITIPGQRKRLSGGLSRKIREAPPADLRPTPS